MAHESTQPRGTDETIKETLESIIIAFVMAFVVRAFVIEAFVIPTGSMAPTLMGHHVMSRCDQCGYVFEVEGNVLHRNDEQSRARELGGMVCPMCHFPNELSAGRSGDRILVQKYVYGFREPRRWDVVVFKAPGHPRGETENFIKRLVGLPEEELALVDGNVYVRPFGEERWRIARKTDRPDVQRAVWQLIYDSRYVPLDGGYAGQGRPAARRWSRPWVAVDEPAWEDLHGGRSYRYRGVGDGELRFAFDRTHVVLQQYPYNQFRHVSEDPMEEVRISAVVVPESDGVSLRFSTTARLDGVGPDLRPRRLSATLDEGGLLRLTAESPDGHVDELARERVSPLRAGRESHVELWYVDQHAMVWIDGRVALEWLFDIDDIEALVGRPRPELLPDVRIELSGGAATLHQVSLARDVYHTSRSATAAMARGALRDGADPVVLEADEFLCMGDNSPWSEDSRFWQTVDPLVQPMFEPGEAKPGVIPRELMMGRAFFVYYPAPFPARERGMGVIPNFGDMRFIR